MTRDEAVAEVQQGLGFRTDLDDQIRTALDQMQDHLEGPGKNLPWWLLEEDASISVTESNQDVTLPTGFLREPEYASFRYKPSASGKALFLAKMDLQAAEEYFFGRWKDPDVETSTATTGLSPGAPRAYVLRKDEIRVYPIPDADYTLTWDYFKAGDSLLGASTGSVWLDNAPWVIIGKAGLKIAMNIRDADAVQYFQGILADAEPDYLADCVSRSLNGRRLRMGSAL